MSFIQLIFFILFGLVLVYCRTVKEEVKPQAKELNSVQSFKESLIISMDKNKTSRGICGGGCMLSSQCSDYAGGDRDCRCSWFSCLQYTKIVKK